MIKRVEHVGIMVSDMDESIRFYETLLHFKVRARVENKQKELCFLSHHGLPGFEIGLICDLDPNTLYSEHGLVNHLAFVVGDIEQVISTCMDKGIALQTGELKQGINGRKTIRFKGPNGETLQLVEERQEKGVSQI